MGLALDEPRGDDEKIEVQGVEFVADQEVVDTIRSYGRVSIHYVDGRFRKGFKVSLDGEESCG